jgi:hypothetical protein
VSPWKRLAQALGAPQGRPKRVSDFGDGVGRSAVCGRSATTRLKPGVLNSGGGHGGGFVAALLGAGVSDSIVSALRGFTVETSVSTGLLAALAATVATILSPVPGFRCRRME